MLRSAAVDNYKRKAFLKVGCSCGNDQGRGELALSLGNAGEGRKGSQEIVPWDSKFSDKN